MLTTRGETGDGEWVLSVLRECIRKSGVREVHSHVEIFDGEDSPPGFAAVVLIDESHVTAHCYSERDSGSTSSLVETAIPPE